MLLLAAARQQRVSLHYAQAGRFDTIPPRFNGGNIDIRGLTMGAKLYLPVHVEGALFSTADCHAAQETGK